MKIIFMNCPNNYYGQGGCGKIVKIRYFYKKIKVASDKEIFIMWIIIGHVMKI